MQTEEMQTTAKEKEFASVRVKTETRDRVLAVVDRLNEKELGRKVIPDDVIALAVTLLKSEHLEQIQGATLSNFDRLESDYREFVRKNPGVSKDEYLGKRISGEITR